MQAWKDSLSAAGIREPQLRRDYDTQRDLVSRFRRTSYLAAQMLLPRPMLPHVVAVTAVMHHGDNLLDTGPKALRVAQWASWEQQVQQVLATGASDEPLLRALAHTIDTHPRTRRSIEQYLSTASAELDFSGFLDEADYQAYIDAYSLPAFMLIGTLLGPEADDRPYRAACRAFIDGSQRLDFVNDITEDLSEGRLGIPAKTLERFAVTKEDLAEARDTPGVRELLRHLVVQARTVLQTARCLPTMAPAPHRPLLSALVEVELLTADAVMARGVKLLRAPATPPLASTLLALWRARREARKGS
ncbi:phytoene synthase [Streptomyces capoamus]|uniref:Phytoene synthase n=1 Tax=Streptomyces capoamus TaxID=68183 RepID=A0A919F2P4_9ACTN|nr:squalene/phytoene synthase family protein [Streptomyces capoamus]GGW13230.1 phytoene synthase [Streptomyces libani subsp. rufus]GHG74410.1 phytoene synthase [Streptomyces capoamus]